MSKSKCTQCRYHKVNNNQKTLDAFVSSACGIPVCVCKLPAVHTITCSKPVTIWQESIKVEIPPAIHEESVDIEMPPAIHEENMEVINPELTQDEDEKNGWEDDLEECMHGCGVSIEGWQELCEQVKKDLKKGGNTSHITKVNQLLVLWHFATPQLKGYSKIKASVQIA